MLSEYDVWMFGCTFISGGVFLLVGLQDRLTVYINVSMDENMSMCAQGYIHV